MPQAYTKMRDKFRKEGMSEKASKGKAARIFNAKRKPGQAPVTRNYEKTVARRRSRSRS